MCIVHICLPTCILCPAVTNSRPHSHVPLPPMCFLPISTQYSSSPHSIMAHHTSLICCSNHSLSGDNTTFWHIPSLILPSKQKETRKTLMIRYFHDLYLRSNHNCPFSTTTVLMSKTTKMVEMRPLMMMRRRIINLA